MPIRTKPFTSITLADVEDLVLREVREDHTMEFKEQLNLEDRDARVEFLKDVTAFANASGGTIVIGAVEGDTDRRGLIVEVRGVSGSPDALGLAIDAALRDGVDERLSGVLHRALPVGGGRHIHVIRVPASPHAPHMIKLRTAEGRFYVRGNVSTDPMTARQIKELAVRRETAIERAKGAVDQRTALLRERGRALQARVAASGTQRRADQAVLHIASLHPRSGGWPFHSAEVVRRLMQVRPFGYYQPYAQERYAHDGLYDIYEDTRHVAFLRSGVIEFQMYDVVRVARDGEPVFSAFEVEHAVLCATADAAAMSADDYLPMPVLVNLRLYDVGETRLTPSPNHMRYDIGRPLTVPEVGLEPIIINEWGPEADAQVTRLLDEMWQAWGLPKSWNFGADGAHRLPQR